MIKAYGRLALRVAIAAICIAGRTSWADTPVSMDSMRLAFYDYDKSLTLNAELKELPNASPKQGELRTRFALSYDSAHDQRVTAIFTVPKKFAAPYPAVVLLAGSGGHKDTDYVRISSDVMSTLGFATISIDAQYHGDRTRPGRTNDIHLINSTTNRDAWVQTVVDLRRAVDYLQSRPDVDKSKIGYLGFSQGGMIGATFVSVEPRIIVACLAVAGGGFAEWDRMSHVVKPEERQTFEMNAEITDPIRFIGHFSPRPLLMLSAKRDELIPRTATDALFSAAHEPKQIIWYNSGHVIPPNAILVDARAFFVKHLGKRDEIAK